MKKILFIEDEPALQKSLGESLEKENFEVIKALDGETGLKMAEELTPDLILLDLILPKKDGLEVLKELKDQEGTKSIPVIVLTNLETSGDIEKVMALGAQNFLVKTNYELDEVVAKIKDILK